MPERPKRRPWQQSSWLAWWYFAIAAGFLLLAVYYHLRGASPWLVALRGAISAAFALLGYFQLRLARAGKGRGGP